MLDGTRDSYFFEDEATVGDIMEWILEECGVQWQSMLLICQGKRLRDEEGIVF